MISNRQFRLPASPVLRAGWLLAVAMLTVAAGPLRAEVAKEYALKAAFVFNFTKFVEWRDDRFPDAHSPIVIGVLGSSPLAAELEAVVAGRTVSGRTIDVRSVATAADANGAHLVFIGPESDARVGEIVSTFNGAGVLTVGESREFATKGGIITFTTDGGRVRFEINQRSGEHAGLRISAQLLKLASAVRRND